MDKNDHLHGLIGGHIERIGDWTPQQLSDFIINISNDPTATPHAFRAKTIHADEVVLRGQRLHLGVAPGAVIMGNRKGEPTVAHPRLSGSNVLNRAYAALDSTAKHFFAESYDMHDTTGGVAYVSGTMRYVAVYVPTRERLTHLYANFSAFETGGTFTNGGWAIYGPLAWNASIPGLNKTQVPQVAITETNIVTNFRATSPHFVANGIIAYTNSWDIVLEPGIYFVSTLYNFSVAPTADAQLMISTTTEPGIALSDMGVPGFIESGTKAGVASLPATLDITSFTYSPKRMWVALADDRTKQI